MDVLYALHALIVWRASGILRMVGAAGRQAQRGRPCAGWRRVFRDGAADGFGTLGRRRGDFRISALGAGYSAPLRASGGDGRGRSADVESGKSLYQVRAGDGNQRPVVSSAALLSPVREIQRRARPCLLGRGGSGIPAVYRAVCAPGDGAEPGICGI